MFRLPIVKFFSRILNRITITVVLVALQVAWLLWVFFSLTTGRVWVNAGLQLLSLLMMLYLVRKDENSAYKIGWIALMGVLPLLGGALYLSFGNKRPAKRLRSKLQAVDEAHKADLAQQPGQTDGLDASGLGMSRYLARYGRYPAWKNTAAQYIVQETMTTAESSVAETLSTCHVNPPSMMTSDAPDITRYISRQVRSTFLKRTGSISSQSSSATSFF